jgi:hypothetical protein
VKTGLRHLKGPPAPCLARTGCPVRAATHSLSGCRFHSRVGRCRQRPSKPPAFVFAVSDNSCIIWSAFLPLPMLSEGRLHTEPRMQGGRSSPREEAHHDQPSHPAQHYQGLGRSPYRYGRRAGHDWRVGAPRGVVDSPRPPDHCRSPQHHGHRPGSGRRRRVRPSIALGHACSSDSGRGGL